MRYLVLWTRRAAKQAGKLPRAEQRRVVEAVGALEDWPGCLQVQDIRRLTRHERLYRLRVGRYRVLFDVDPALEVVSVEQVRKRDERTY
ncbi:MAG: type II toxin-antitoxin system RelE/ParE family toxin [Gammaproteobacteria bacterium]|nr:MAG: type II toxin-antitoxin system RelE/ParE family toxin [Gammaproteobacteria bacterium]